MLLIILQLICSRPPRWSLTTEHKQSHDPSCSHAGRAPAPRSCGQKDCGMDAFKGLSKWSYSSTQITSDSPQALPLTLGKPAFKKQLRSTDIKTFSWMQQNRKSHQSSFFQLQTEVLKEAWLHFFFRVEVKWAKLAARVPRKNSTSGKSLLHLWWVFSLLLFLFHFPWLQLTSFLFSLVKLFNP